MVEGEAPPCEDAPCAVSREQNKDALCLAP